MRHFFCHLVSVLFQPTPGWYCYPIQHVKNTVLILSPAFCFFCTPTAGYQWLPSSTLFNCCCHMRLQRGLHPYNSWPTGLFFTLHDYWLLNSPCGDMVIIVQQILTQCRLPGGGVTFPLCPGQQHSHSLSLKTYLPDEINHAPWSLTKCTPNHSTWP